MGIIDTISRWFQPTRHKAQVVDPPQFAIATAQVEEWAVPSIDTYEAQSDFFRVSSWVASGVELLANTSATIDFSVKRRVGEDKTDIPNHEFETLLDNPNPLQTRFELVMGTVGYYKVNGNAYWWLNRSSPNEPPSEIWLIPSNRITPVPDGKLFLKGYVYDPGDCQEIALEPYEVVHFRRWNPRSMFFGLSAMEAVGMQVYTDQGRIKFDYANYNKNAGRLPSVLAFKQAFSPTQWEQLKTQVRDQESKRQMMLLHGVGDGLQWLTNSMTMEDAQFLQSRTFTKEEIYAMLAPGLASILAVNATEANAKAGKATLMEYAVWPMLVMMAQRITTDILTAYGPDIVGEFDDPRVVDRVLEMQEADNYAKYHTLAEVREKYHQSKPLGDERDNLLIAQITADSGQPEPEPMPTQQPAAQGDTMPPMAEIDQEDEDGDLPDMMQAELAKWRRKALNSFKRGKGAAVEFDGRSISARVSNALRLELAVCKTADQVNQAFDAALSIADTDDKLTPLLARAVEILEDVRNAA